jgi:hypothetical protein
VWSGDGRARVPVLNTTCLSLYALLPLDTSPLSPSLVEATMSERLKRANRAGAQNALVLSGICFVHLPCTGRSDSVALSVLECASGVGGCARLRVCVWVV